jgi:hypothetical protein
MIVNFNSPNSLFVPITVVDSLLDFNTVQQIAALSNALRPPLNHSIYF